MSHLAHFNWGTLRAPVGDPAVAKFVDAVGRVNDVAERSPGFVWRHGDEARAGTEIGWPLFDDPTRTIASFSVWKSPEDFRTFVHKTVHGAFLKRRESWFEDGGGPSYVLWWVPEGHIPTIEEARARVEALISEGPGEAQFTLADLSTETNG